MIPALGTFVRIELELPELVFHRAVARAISRIQKLEKLLSVFDSESEISLLNRTSPKRYLKLSLETLEVLKFSAELQNDSNRAFCIGNHLSFRDDEVRKENEESIDLGGIAKGYAVDQAWDELMLTANEAGIKEVFGSVNAGGDLKINERKIVEIKIESAIGKYFSHPMKRGALASSSRRFREGASAVYSPRMEPKRQMVSIEAKSAWLADGLTKVALFQSDPFPCLKKWNAELIYEA